MKQKVLGTRKQIDAIKSFDALSVFASSMDSDNIKELKKILSKYVDFSEDALMYLMPGHLINDTYGLDLPEGSCIISICDKEMSPTDQMRLEKARLNIGMVPFTKLISYLRKKEKRK